MLVQRFAADGVDVPVDIDHATARKAAFGEAAPAVGWIGRMEARPDGLYGFVHWLAEGARVLAARTHRYLSPALQADANGSVKWVHSVALVAAPALSMPALATAQTSISNDKAAPHAPPETLGASSMRIVTPAILDAAFRGFKASFQGAFDGENSYKSTVAMEVKSQTAEETYAWLGSWPNMREWVGARHIHGLKAHGYSIKNRIWESTVAVMRTEIEDDKLGLFGPRFSEMGRVAKQHPDGLIFDLLKNGFSTVCYDGQNFFDTDHPVGNAPAASSVSNMQAGNEAPWFLIDASRAIKPIVWQERDQYEFQTMEDAKSERVFMRDEYLYGIRSRANCGFGLWQLAFGSKAVLNTMNLEAAYTAMRQFKDDSGQPLGVRPTHIIVGASNFFTARKLLLTANNDGTSNPNLNLVEIINPPFLD